MRAAAIFAIYTVLVVSQIYWAFRLWSLLRRRLSPWPRIAVACLVASAYYGACWYNADRLFRLPGYGPQPNPTGLGLADSSFAIIQWWLLCSFFGFLVAVPVWVLRLVVRFLDNRRRRRAIAVAPEGGSTKDAEIVPARRHFLEQTASAVVAAPFVLGGYALLYGRLNLEVTQRQLRLARLPQQFHGFRIAQLSDIHISAFMSEEQIHKFAVIANSLRADLIVLTGDFITWDPDAEKAVVRALSGLRAPFGVMGCLGNHDAWAGTEDSLSELFQQAGIRILRDEATAVRTAGAQLNLIGIEPEHGWNSTRVPDGLIAPDAVNILLSHYPTVFDHAAKSGIDLMLAGHTHGGQVNLNFISPKIAPRYLHTRYLVGHYEQQGSQLYVNRGIGTIGVPMRAGVSPEITVFELIAG